MKINGVIETKIIKASDKAPGHLIQAASDIEAKAIDWLWEPYISRGAFSLIEGEEGLGKTFLICSFATIISTGGKFPLTEKPIEPGNVLIYTAEDSLSQQIVPRLQAMGADLSRVLLCDEMFSLDEKGFKDFEYDLAVKKPVLTIFDPLFSYTEGNTSSEEITRPIAKRMKEIAEKLDSAIIGIRHIGKAKGYGEARAAGIGSIAWRAAARIVLLIGKDPEDERKKALVQTKNNMGPICQKAVGFEINTREGMSPFFWTGESRLTAQKILSATKSEEDKAEIDDSLTFLREALAGGERLAIDVKNEAAKLGFTEQNLKTARNKLGLRYGNGMRKEGFGKRVVAYWSLPKPETNHVSTKVDDASIKVSEKINQLLCVSCGNKTCSHNDLPIKVSEKNNQLLCEQNAVEPTFMDGQLFGPSSDDRQEKKFEIEQPRPRVCPCIKCKEYIGINAEECHHCGAKQEIPF